MILSPRSETVLGAAMMAALALAFALGTAGGRSHREDGSYSLFATFRRADGVGVGSPVRVSGVDIGAISGQTLDPYFQASIRMRIDRGVAIPVDSAAVIETDGFLGTKYIEIQPGGMDATLQPGQKFEYTQDSLALEDLLNRILTQAHGGKNTLDKRVADAAQGEIVNTDAPADKPQPAGNPFATETPSLRDLLKRKKAQRLEDSAGAGDGDSPVSVEDGGAPAPGTGSGGERHMRLAPEPSKRGGIRRGRNGGP